MFRVIKRAPWIALGAAAAYFLDSDNGPARRREIAERARQWGERMRAQWQDRDDRASHGSDQGSDQAGAPTDAPLTPSVPDELVESRAGEPLAEEQASGVSGEASTTMAERILEESEWRVTDPEGTRAEQRRSEETVSGAG